MNLFIYYPKCSTCKKVKQFLDEHHIVYEERNVKENPPTTKELTLWVKKYSLSVRKLFNTSGILYRSLSLKDKLPLMNEKEMLELLGDNGMLVKRPLFITDEKIFIGGSLKDYEVLT